MPGNPLIPLGGLNRVIAGVQFDTFPGLNISASYLGKEGIRLVPDGMVTTKLPAMTGYVTSPEPYQVVTVTVNLLKSQALGAAFKAQIENLTSLVGNFVVYPDTTVSDPNSGVDYSYSLTNGIIENAVPGPFDGNDALWVLTLGGQYNINLGLWP